MMAEKPRVIKLKGEIDHHSAARMRAELDRLIEHERPRELVLDFSEVRMMDSSGVGLLLGRYKNVKRLGGALFVKNVTRGVDRVFEMSGIYQIIGKL